MPYALSAYALGIATHCNLPEYFHAFLAAQIRLLYCHRAKGYDCKG